LQTAIFEALILGVVVTVQTGFAIALGVFATVMLALVKSNLSFGNIRQSIMSRQMAIGLAAGAFLGFCTVSYGAAMKAMIGGSLLSNAVYAAAIGVTIQAVCFGAYLYFARRHEFIASFVEWRGGAMAGVWAAICSICWFAAFLNHEVAPVRAVGQVELLFSIGFSVLYFKERVSRLELAAMALLALSIVMVLLD
jgi:drug/metabolite transporter (DMT)-like permease